MANLPIKKGVIKAVIQPYLDTAGSISDHSDTNTPITNRIELENKWNDSILFTSKCEYCILESPISGRLTLTRDCLFFEPDERDATVISSGPGNYQVYIDILSIYECACISAPIHSSFLEGYDERINLKAFLQVLINNSDLPESHKTNYLTNEDTTDTKITTKSTQKIFSVGSAIYSKLTQLANYVYDSTEDEFTHDDLIKFIDLETENSKLSDPPGDYSKNPHPETFSEKVFVLFGFFDIELARHFTMLIMDLLDSVKTDSPTCITRVTRLPHSSNSLLHYWLNENKMPSGWSTSHSARYDRKESISIATTLENALESDIFSSEMMDQLQEYLPPDCAIRSWKRCFSTSIDGVSLLTLYHNLEDKGPCIIAIQDTNNNVFGSFVDQLISSNHYYGTPQVFVYKFKKTETTTFPSVYYPDAHGRCFVFSNGSRIAIGGDGSGNSALTIDNDLYRGTTDHCDTFKNPPLVESGEFLIKHFEVWAFVDL